MKLSLFPFETDKSFLFFSYDAAQMNIQHLLHLDTEYMCSSELEYMKDIGYMHLH